MTIFNSVIGGGGGSVKVPLNDISTLSATPGDKEATITWTDVGNLTVNGVLLNTWNATKLVRKVGSAPSDSSDGTLVVTETVADTYSSTGYTDTGLTNGTTYYYKAFSVGSNGLESGSNSADVTPAQQGWQPGANTVAYYPLTDDFDDHKTSGTLYNLTQNSAGLTTLDGVKCCDLNNSYCSANFVITTLPYSIIFWSKWKGNNSQRAFGLNFVAGGAWGGSGLKYQGQVYIRYGNPTDMNSGVSSYTINTAWHLYAITFSSSGCKFYVDGVLIAIPKNSLSAPSNNASPFYIGADEEAVTRSDCYQGITIIEDKERAAQEISDYFNQTKGDYGIS